VTIVNAWTWVMAIVLLFLPVFSMPLSDRQFRKILFVMIAIGMFIFMLSV
jgi:hypothetical protein